MFGTTLNNFTFFWLSIDFLFRELKLIIIFFGVAKLSYIRLNIIVIFFNGCISIRGFHNLGAFLTLFGFDGLLFELKLSFELKGCFLRRLGLKYRHHLVFNCVVLLYWACIFWFLIRFNLLLLALRLISFILNKCCNTWFFERRFDFALGIGRSMKLRHAWLGMLMQLLLYLN